MQHDAPHNLSNLFKVVNFTENDSSMSLKVRTLNEYKEQMLTIDTNCVVQWPRNLTDETLIRGNVFDSLRDADRGCQGMQDDQMKDGASAEDDMTAKFYEETLTCPVCYNLVTGPADCLECDLTLCGGCEKKVKKECP